MFAKSDENSLDIRAALAYTVLSIKELLCESILLQIFI